MPKKPRFKAILFDFGGVLTSSPFDAFNRYEIENGIPKNFIRKLNSQNPDSNAWARFESGKTTLDEFDAEFLMESTQAGYRISGRTVISLLHGKVRPRMVRVVERCKRHFKVACLTNNMPVGQDTTTPPPSSEQHSVKHIMQLFNLVVESSREGVRKPQIPFYQIACDRLGINANRCIFLDDLGINLKPAREMGMTTIKVVSEIQAITDLEIHTGLDLSD